MSYGSLEEAVLYGTELERSYVCANHNDHRASASVNGTTGLFCCYTCGHKGKIDPAKLVMTGEGVMNLVTKVVARLNPDSDRYSESWLNTFDASGPGPYWLSRFGPETCRYYRLGTAPGVATYPMRDNLGRCVGVVSRDLTGAVPKYRYPYRIQVSNHLIDYHRVDADTVVLVEGMADVAAVYEAGHHVALGCYKAGLSTAQAKLLKRYAPKQILVAFDMDEAGDKGFGRVRQLLGSFFPVKRMWWDGYRDVAEIPLSERIAMMDEVLSPSHVDRHRNEQGDDQHREGNGHRVHGSSQPLLRLA